VENSVAFVEPAGLRVDEIGERATGEGCGASGDGLLIEMVDGTGALGIEKSILRDDLNGGAQGGDVEPDGVLSGKSGMDLDGAVVGSEIWFVDLKAILGEREIADDEEAGIVGGEGAMELESVTGEIDGSLDGLAIGAGDFEAKLSGIALRQEWEREEKDGEVEK
jgi:hypothetical protein